MAMERFDLRRARIDRGKSLRQAASEIGVNTRVLHAAELYGTVPQPSNQLRIAAYYDRKPSEVWVPEREAA